MARLTDSSVLIEWEKPGRPLTELTGGDAEAKAIASITAAELLVGVERAIARERKLRREAYVEEVLRRFPILAFDLYIARVHARLWARRAAIGQPIGEHDLLIAATAVAHGYEIETLNVRHFERVPGLVVRQPTWCQTS